MKKQYSNKSGKAASGHYSLGNKKQARKPLIIALEPRLLLDGAAVATAVDVLTDSQLHDASQTDNSHQGSDTSFVVAPTEVRAVDPSLNNGKKEVIFIEDNVADYQSLIDGANAGVEVVLLDSTQDGLSQMAEWAKTHSDYDAIHLISHGSEGQLNLGGLTLDASTVNTRSDDLAQLGAALNEEGDLLLYGCSVASGEGQNFIEALAQATQSDVAASDDLTGAAKAGGDWVLEYSTGTLNVATFQNDSYQNALATSYTVTTGDNTGDDASPLLNDYETDLNDGGGLSLAEALYYASISGDTVAFNLSSGATEVDMHGLTMNVAGGVTFDTNAMTTLSITNGTLNMGGNLTVTNGSDDMLTISSTLTDGSSSYNLAKTGAGTLTLSGTNTYDGTTTVSAGVLSVAEDSNLGSGALSLGGGTLQITGADTIDNAITLTADSTVKANAQATLSGVVSGAHTLTSSGSSFLTLSNSSNTFTGLNIASGYVVVSDAGNLGDGTTAVTLSGGGLQTQGVLSFSNSLTLAANSTLETGDATTWSGAITGSATLTKAGAGNLTLSGANSGSWGLTMSSGGGLTVTDSSNLGTGALGLNAGGFHVTGAGTFSNAISLIASSTITTDAAVTLSGQISGASKTLTKAGAGTMTLSGSASGSNSWNTIVSAGTLKIGAAANIGTGAITLNSNTTLQTVLSSSQQLSNTVTLNDNATIQTDASNNSRLTLSGTVSGGGNTLTKSGSGDLVLSGNNSGTTLKTTVTAGNLMISSNANLGSGELTLNGGTLYLQSASAITHGITLGESGGTILVAGADATVSGDITGSGALTKGGGRVLTLGGSNNFSGGFNIAGSAGGANVIVADGNNLGTGAVTLTKGLQITGSGTITNDFVLNGGLISNANGVILSGVISGSGAMEKVDTGSLTLSGASNSWSGTTTVSSGTLTGTTSSLTGNIINNAAVEFSQSTAGEYSKVISGTGTVTKSGSGILTLSGVNTYTGSTTVSFGGLTLVGGSNIADTSAVTLASATTLTLSGGNETIGSLAGAGNVVLGYRLTTGGNNTDTTFSGVISSTNTSGITKTGSGIFTLSGTNTYTGATTVSAGTLMVSSGSAIADTSAVTIASGAIFELDASVSETVGSIAGAGSIVANGGTLTVGGDNSSTTFSGVMSERADALNLVKLGSGTLTLSGSNEYAGTTTVSGGKLEVANDAALGTAAGGTVVASGATLQATAGISIADALTLSGTGVNGAGALVVSGNGTVSASGAITLGAATTVAVSDADTILSLSNNIGGAYGLTKVGAGMLSLGGNSQGFTTLTVGAGSLSAGLDANLGSGAVTLEDGTLWSIANNGGTIDNAIVLNGSAVLSASLSTTLAGGISGSGSLTKQSSGTLTLSGSNSYTGTTTITGGTLAIGGDGNLGAGGLTLNGGTLSVTGSGVTIDNSISLGSNGGSVSNANGVTLSGAISGAGAMEKVGAGLLSLSGTNTYTGTTTVSAGTLSGTASSLTGNIINNAALEFSQSSDGTYSKVISGTGTVIKSGVGTLTLTGANTYTGTTTVSAGSLTLNNASGTALADTSAVTLSGTAALTLATNETIGGLTGVSGNTVVLGANTLTVNQTSSTNFAGVISGTGGVIKTGVGIQSLSGVNTYTGATTVSAGTLLISGGSAIADASAVTVASGATFELDASVSETVGSIAGAGSIVANGGTLTVGGDNSSTTFSGVISERSDALSLVKLGSGTLTLSGVNAYTGATSLNAGTLSVTGALVATSGVTVNSGATLGGSGSVFATSSSNTLTVNNGGFLAPGVSGINSGAGALTVNGNLILNGTLKADIAGTSAGTGYDQVIVKGDVTLGANSAFDVNYSTSASGSTFVMIDNQGANAMTGTLSGLAEGGILASGGSRFITSYLGGNGNDITQKAISTPVVSVVDVTGAINEGSILTDSGSITFTDSDASSRPTATATVKSVAGKGQDGVTSLTVTADQLAAIKSAFSISSAGTNTNNGTINWIYEIAENNIGFLNQGETVVAVFTITLTNSRSGTSTTQDVTITITGKNSPAVSATVTAPPISNRTISTAINSRSLFSIDVALPVLPTLLSGTVLLTNDIGSSGFLGNAIVDSGNANAGNNGAGTGVPATVISSSSVAVNVGADGRVQVSQASGVSTNTTGLSVATMINQADRVSISLADTGTAANYSGTMSDGASLPSWVQVNPTTGEVSMTPPAGQGKITLKINAVDRDGNIRVLEIEVDLANVPESVQGQPVEPANTPNNTVNGSNASAVNGVTYMSLDEQLNLAAEQIDDYGSDLMKLLAS